MVNADDVLAYLEAEGVGISRDRLREYLIEITSSEAFLHPAAELGIMTALLEGYSTGAPRTDRTTVFMESLPRIKSFPHVLFLGVLTRDWAGLADCAAGVVHEKGWNISFLKGVTLRYGQADLGCIIIGIKIEDAAALEVLGTEKDTFLRDLRQVAPGSKAKSFLITRRARTLEIFGQVIEYIQRTYTADDLERIVGEEGEAVKFFASRSYAYLLERTVEDLARQVITNFEFVKRVRDSGGIVQIDVANLVTTRERLTGITVAGFDRDISLGLILDALRKAFAGFQRKFNKEFSTQDGITLYRLELCDARSSPADDETLTRIRQTLEKAASKKKVERASWIESTGGFEHYARAIIPFLVKEHETTKVPQVFLAAGQASETMQEFKLIMVLPHAVESSDPLPQLFEAIDGVPGLGIVSTHPPKVMGRQRVEMLDVSANLELFQEREQIYALLKSRLGQIIGEFRDFDEGMRRADRSNLQRCRDLLPDVDENVLRDIYYHLDDFYRVGAPVPELAQLIALAVKSMGASAANAGALEVMSGSAAMDVGSEEPLVTATLLAVAYSSERNYFRHVLKQLSGYDCTMSKVNRDDATVLTFRVMKDHRPLAPAELEQVAERIRAI